MRHIQAHVAAILLLVLTSTRCVSAFLSTPLSGSPLILPQAIATTDFHVPVRDNAWVGNKGSMHGRSQGGSSSALGMTTLPAASISISLTAIGAGIASFYRSFPLIAGFITCATKAGFADSMAQYRDVCTTQFNFKRNIAMVLYSGLILGVSCEIMYNKFFPILFGTEQSMAKVIKMVLFDGFVNAPLFWLPPAYIAQALVYRYPKRQAIQKYITDVKENGLLKKYWSLWIPMSLINFSLVPPHFRVAFVAAVSFFWMIILSIVANNNDQDPESCPVEPEPVMLNPRALD